MLVPHLITTSRISTGAFWKRAWQICRTHYFFVDAVQYYWIITITLINTKSTGGWGYRPPECEILASFLQGRLHVCGQSDNRTRNSRVSWFEVDCCLRIPISQWRAFQRILVGSSDTSLSSAWSGLCTSKFTGVSWTSRSWIKLGGCILTWPRCFRGPVVVAIHEEVRLRPGTFQAGWTPFQFKLHS